MCIYVHVYMCMYAHVCMCMYVHVCVHDLHCCCCKVRITSIFVDDLQ